MLKAGTETGSAINHLMSRQGPEAVVPEVGMGVTILAWTDRYAGTIVKVTKTQIHVQTDIAKRIDKNGMSESQEYEHVPNPEASIQIFRKTKKGWRKAGGGSGLLIGVRDEYYDFSY